MKLLSENKFSIVGCGQTGLSVLSFLEFMGWNIVKIFDTRNVVNNVERFNRYNLVLGELNINDFKDIDVIVISPGVSIYDKTIQELIRQNKIVIGDIELFALMIKEWKCKIIAITGSNGKTTVTTLVGELCVANNKNTIVAGNIGNPILYYYISCCNNSLYPDVIVLELSSFQLETIKSLNIDVATVLNISEDHLDRYNDLLHYAYVKSLIFNNVNIQVLNANDKLVMAMTRVNTNKVIFGKDIGNCDCNNIFEIKNNFLYINGEEYLNLEQVNLIGEHNYLNISAALALVKAINIDIFNDNTIKAIKSFNCIEHRMELVLVHNGILIIDDSKGTNVGAVISGISGLKNSVHLILGGEGKGQNFYPLRNLVKEKCKSVAIIGKDKNIIANVLKNLDIKVELFEKMDDAVSFCFKHAQENDAIVLSPACSSLDMFDNYKHRAQVFIESVYANIK